MGDLTFAWRSAVDTLGRGGSIAKDTPDGEIFETSEGEAEEGAVEDEKEDKVVTLLEADGVVDFAGHADEAIRWWAFGSTHIVMCNRPRIENRSESDDESYSV